MSKSTKKQKKESKARKKEKKASKARKKEKKDKKAAKASKREKKDKIASKARKREKNRKKDDSNGNYDNNIDNNEDAITSFAQMTGSSGTMRKRTDFELEREEGELGEVECWVSECLR